MNALADIFAALAVRVLQWWSNRRDTRRAIRAEDMEKAYELAVRALAYKARNRPHSRIIERLSRHAGGPKIQGFTPDDDGGADSGDV